MIGVQMMDKLLEIPQPNYRAMRAKRLAADIMQRLNRYIPDALLPRAQDELIELFGETDAEVVTEHDRRAAGLPERNELGLSPEEHVAIEARKLQTLVQPPTVNFCMVCGVGIGKTDA
jgi:hypothetical protein